MKGSEMNRVMRLLFLDIITDDPSFRDYDEKMLHRYGGHKGLINRGFGLMHHVDDVVPGLTPLDLLPDISRIIAEGYDGVFFGGSIADVEEKSVIKPWQEWVFEVIRRLAVHKIPMLGVCGGHQYGVRALTGEANSVIRNTLGEHFGTSSVSLTREGLGNPLFVGCGEKFDCQWSHHCIAAFIPDGSVCLADHSMTHHAAFEHGSFIGLQWHPELATLEEDGYGVGIMRMIAKIKKSGLISGGVVLNEDAFAEFLQNRIQPATCSKRILQNWLNMIASGYFKK